MLSKEQNELLCRVGPGTLMGTLFRRYWLPLMRSDELEADGAPVRIRILGEDLVAFRDTDGKVGLVDELCPHRLAPLAIGRNEECGLRCLYHGWKYDIEGNCVDMPNEPEDSNFKSKVTLTAYPTREQGDVVWTYMGKPERVPGFPIYRWTLAPSSHRVMARWLQEANWMQSLEGGIDTSHASFLHRRFDTPLNGPLQTLMFSDKAPRLELQPTNYGFRYAAIRDGGDGQDYVRITPHIMPCSSYPPGRVSGNMLWNAWVPRDDESCWAWDVNVLEERPFEPDEIERLRAIRGYNAYDPVTKQKFGNRDNLWLQDREEMKTVSWSGIEGIFVQDNAVQEGMGRTVDRTREHLGTADQAIIAARRGYLRAAQLLVEEGIDPPGVNEADVYEFIESYAYLQPQDQAWQDVQPLDAKFSPAEAQKVRVF